MITIYSKSNCPYCEQSKEYLDHLKVPYQEINISDNSDALKFIRSEGHKTVPQFYKNEKLFIKNGYSGLMLTDTELLYN